MSNVPYVNLSSTHIEYVDVFDNRRTTERVSNIQLPYNGVLAGLGIYKLK